MARSSSLPCQAAVTSPVGSPAASPARSRTHPRLVSCSAAVSSSLRMRYSGSGVRPRWPRVACWIRRRTWSTTALASRTAWKWSTTTLAWPSGVTSALAYPRQGSRATVAMRASQSRGRAPSQPATAALVRSATASSSRPPSRSTRPVTYRVGARRVALRKLVSSSPSAATSSRRMGSSTSWVPWSATARMTVAHPPPDHGPPRPPRGRPCRPADTPRRGPARSAPPEDGSRPSARSRSGSCRPAPDNARSACATTAPPAGHRSAGPAPPPGGGRGARPGSHSPHSRSPWPWSGPRAAIHPLRPARRGPRSHQGRAAPTRTHYCVDPPGASFLQTSRIRKLCEVPGLFWRLLRHPQQGTAPRFMTKSPIVDLHGHTRDAAWMAPPHGAPTLDLSNPATRPTADSRSAAELDRAAGHREPTVGLPAHPRGAAAARLPSLRQLHRQGPAGQRPPAGAASSGHIPDLAGVPTPTGSRHPGVQLPHRGPRVRATAERAVLHSAAHPARIAGGRHHPPHRRLGRLASPQPSRHPRRRGHSRRFLIRDRDHKFTRAFDDIWRAVGALVIRTPIQAPNANSVAERWVGTVRREYPDHLLIGGRRRLLGVLGIYTRHYIATVPTAAST